MARDAYRDFRKNETPQSEAIPGTVPNNAGGHSYEVGPFAQMRRFLILGSDSGTYYVGSSKLTRENASVIEQCLGLDPEKAIDMIVEVSDQALAPKNDPALFALAIAFAHGGIAAYFAEKALPKVARTGTHLFHFLEYANNMRGWGRTLKRAVANWYLEKPIDSLALQAVKYKQRDGWSHADALRLSHPKTDDVDRNSVFGYMVGKDSADKIGIINTANRLQNADPAAVAKILRETGCSVREIIPTEALNLPNVWNVMLENGMPVTAMVRNLGKMTSIGVIKPFSDGTKLVVKTLKDKEAIRKSRIHPIQVLIALVTYKNGQGLKGSLRWEPVDAVLDALDSAFYESFKNVEPSGKNVVIALDVSGSMSWAPMNDSPLTAMQIAAAMAMVTVRTEPNYQILGFSHKLVEVPITKTDSLADVIKKMRQVPMGGTDCALPMLWALNNKVPNVDIFQVYTDNETWYGSIHPSEALRKYRRQYNNNAKLAVIAATATKFSIADPTDPGMLDVAGFDASVPAVLADFARD